MARVIRRGGTGHGRFREGDYKTECSRTGAVDYRSDMRKEWDGQLTRQDVWMRKPPLDEPIYQPMQAVPSDPRPPREYFLPEAGFFFLQDSNGGFLQFSDGNLITTSH